MTSARPPSRARRTRRRGQALLEYVITLAMMLTILFGLLAFIGVFTEYGWRILTLVGLRYP